MNQFSNEDICDWLRDAHAMEEQAEQLFSGQANRLEAYGGLKAKLQTELQYIKENQVLLANRIEQLGTSKSVIKDAAAKVVAATQNILGMAMTDEPVKGILALHTFTQMEIGSYKILVAAADAVGDIGTKQICNNILSSTEKRAAWIEKELDLVTKNFLAAKAA